MRYSLLVFFLVVSYADCTTTKPKPEAKVLPWQFYFGSEPSQPSDDPAVKDAQSRAVTVITADGACSGGIGATNIVLTAAHCSGDNKDIFVNGYKARVLSKGAHGQDLLFLRIYTGEVKPLGFADPKTDMEVFVVMTQNEFRGVVKHGRITHVQEETFSTDIVLIPGASGAFVYTKDGNLVGIVTRWNALMSQCVSGTKIRQVVFENN